MVNIQLTGVQDRVYRFVANKTLARLSLQQTILKRTPFVIA